MVESGPKNFNYQSIILGKCKIDESSIMLIIESSLTNTKRVEAGCYRRDYVARVTRKIALSIRHLKRLFVCCPIC